MSPLTSFIAAAPGSAGGLSSSAVNIVIGLLVLAWLISGQLRRKPLNARTRLGLILAVTGLVETWNFLRHTHVTGGDLALTGLSIVIGAGLAAVRARTTRLWQEQGTVWQQGTWLTALLWIVGLGQHLLLDALAAPGLGPVSLLLYFGAIIFAQRLVVLGRARARGLVPAGPAVSR
jgi:hypothetical protein